MAANQHRVVALRRETSAPGLAAFGLLLGAALLWAAPAPAQEAQATIGLEQMSLEARISRLETLHDQTRSGILTMHEQVRATDERVYSLTGRISRGEQPLVALEIEQLWAVVTALQEENAELRELLASAESDGN